MNAGRAPVRLNFWMTVCALPALMILIGLGVWQLQRLDWKEALLAERAARLAAPPISLSAVPADGWRDYELRRVAVRGRYLFDKSLEIQSRTWRGRPGVHIVTPLALEADGTILVDRGWAPPPDMRRPGEMRRPEGVVSLEGVLRTGGKTSAWVPDNEPARGIWFFADPAAMAAAAGLPNAKPYLIEAAFGGEEGYPHGGRTRTEIPNNHLQYALTWFGLAAALVAIYVLYHVRRRGG
jgi:surfeit locus 1 family protein